jgi:hypothetical protein
LAERHAQSFGEGGARPQEEHESEYADRTSGVNPSGVEDVAMHRHTALTVRTAAATIAPRANPSANKRGENRLIRMLLL